MAAAISSSPELAWTDYLTIAIYFVVVLIVGLWATFRPNRDSSEGYFLAGKDMSWFPVGASLFSTNCGAQMFIGMAGSAAASGLSVAVYELHAGMSFNDESLKFWVRGHRETGGDEAASDVAMALLGTPPCCWQRKAVYFLVFLGWVVNPVYTATGAFTVPQYVRRRFRSRRLQASLASVMLCVYISNLIASQIFTGTLIMRHVLGWNTYLSVFAILAVTTVYTIVGGLAAVMYTDALQTFIYMTGALVVLFRSLDEIGGWENLMRKYAVAVSNLTTQDPQRYGCGLPPERAFHIWRPLTDSQTPWTGAVTGLTLMGMNYWCFDQVEVQRGLAAKNVTHVKAGALLCGALKVIAAFFFIIPGMVSRAIYPEKVACSDPEVCNKICQNPSGCWNIAYPLLIVNLLPSGLQGLMLAAILAALMSTLTSVFNSASALFTIDIWKNIRPRSTEKESIMVSRTCVLVMMALSILWLPVLELSPGGQLWDTIQRVAAYCSTPSAVVLLFALFWKRTSEAGAFWGLLGGLLIGISRLSLDWVYPQPVCGSGVEDTRPALLAKVNYLHFAAIIGIITSAVIVVVSLGTSPIPKHQLHRVTWWTCRSIQLPDFSDIEDPPLEPPLEPQTGSQIQGKKKLTTLDKLNEILFVWICGLTDSPKPEMSKEEKDKIMKKQTSIKDVRRWKTVVDVVAVALSVITTAIFGFFA